MARSVLVGIFAAFGALCMLMAGPARAQDSGPRLALVIGNAQYAEPLATAANDAGLVAETLRGAGFDVTGGANLDQDSLRKAFRDFLEKATQAGPDAVIFVYIAGRGLQYEGENYFVPIDAAIQRDTDVPLQALRLSDFTRALAAIPSRARIVVVDAARANRFAPGGNLAGGLALVDAEPGALYAFNAAPGTIAPDEPGPYGAYAQALSELLREGGAPIDVTFSQVRLRVNEATRGAVTPWDAANIAPPLVLLQAAANAPAVAAAQSYAALQARPIGSFPANEAYAAALERDTIQGYQDFLVAFPRDALAGRVRALLAARREALTWRRTFAANTPDAYWSYMQRYPKGPHFYDARRRLALLSAPVEPPPRFDVYDFGGLPPPPPVEYEIIDQPVVIFTDYPPPPPPPIYFLPPPRREFIGLPPPPPPQGPGFLPIPIPIPVPFGRHDGPQGRFNQLNFGQQQPAVPGGRPGFPAPGGGSQQGAPPQGGLPQGHPGPGGQPGRFPPGQPGAGPQVPGQSGPAPARPGGPGPAQPGPGAGQQHPVQAVPGQTAPHPGAPAVVPNAPAVVPNPAAPGSPPAAPNGRPPRQPGPSGAGAAPGVRPAGAPNHAPPQGAGQAPGAHPPAASPPQAVGAGIAKPVGGNVAPAAPKPAPQAVPPAHPDAPPPAKPQSTPQQQFMQNRQQQIQMRQQQIQQMRQTPPPQQRPQPQQQPRPQQPPPPQMRPQPQPQRPQTPPQPQKPHPATPGQEQNQPPH